VRFITNVLRPEWHLFSPRAPSSLRRILTVVSQDVKAFVRMLLIQLSVEPTTFVATLNNEDLGLQSLAQTCKYAPVKGQQ
jgi:hypothetical protein